MLVEAGIMIAFAQILSYIKVYEAPFGGSVTAGSMIPIILFSLRWGTKQGIITGIVYGILQFILGGAIFSLHILSIFLDYLIAFGVLGLAGVYRNNKYGALVGTFLAISARFISHLLSGVIVWSMYAPEGMNPWVYSAIYNVTYLGPELIISLILVSVIFDSVIKRFITTKAI
jgi:thiamine transporter